MIQAHHLSNLAVVALIAGVAALAWWLRRDPAWRALAARVWRERRGALLVAGLYAVIGLLDSVTWIGGGGDLVTRHQPRSVVDRAFPPDYRERSYSAPLAAVEFYGGAPLQFPGTHLLGTDILGRDVLLQALKGVRVALLIGGFSSLIVIPLALLAGLCAGYFGRRVDDLVFFVISTLSSIPTLLLLIALVMVLGRGTLQVCVALGITGWVSFARVVRGETLKLRELDYVAAARALGASDGRIIARHILPNLLHLVAITFVLLFSRLVLAEAMLSWLGIGIDGSWGQMIDQARDELARDPVVWWNLSAAAAALFGLILSVNLIGDAVRDALDPRSLRQ
ncbi:MAG: ABC transporter permease [Deltaproteobacteria bacterium]|nr:ABC transporter permease [Deltaproteobacteria bacterium]